jgi:NhaP-type Na+/H+ or K+/H+ antiporter
MHLEIGTAIAVVLALGLGAEWLAWVLRLPSVLVLLAAGFVSGPVLGLLDLEFVSGDALMSLVSLSVGVILFEGSLSLRFSDLGGASRLVLRLLTIGVAITWVTISAVAVVVFGMSVEVAILLGAILLVTGPTVIVPLLLHLRPVGQSGAALRWEGIINDPIGVALAVLVFEAVAAGSLHQAGVAVVGTLLGTVLFGSVLGGVGAAVVILALKRYWLPDSLHSPVALSLAVAAFAASNTLQPDSGLLAVTVMGIALANQRAVSIVHIIEFKENLRVLLISMLFIVLAANVDGQAVQALLPQGLLFVAIVVLLARPLAVFLSTVGAGATFREKAFMSWLAPRGIVAASIASLFAFRLESLGYADAALIEPITFIVVAATVLVYGLTAAPLARRLGLAEQRPQGVLIMGADHWVREIAAVLQSQGIRVLLVDSNWAHLAAARMSGLRAVYSSVVSQYTLDELDLGGVGRLLAMSPIDEFNTLAVQHFSGIFGRANVYQVAPDTGGRTRASVSPRLTGRILFGRDLTFSLVARLVESGSAVKTTCLTEEFTLEEYKRYYGGAARILFAVEPSGRLHVQADDSQTSFRPGACLVSLIVPKDETHGDALP